MLALACACQQAHACHLSRDAAHATHADSSAELLHAPALCPYFSAYGGEPALPLNIGADSAASMPKTLQSAPTLQLCCPVKQLFCAAAPQRRCPDHQASVTPAPSEMAPALPTATSCGTSTAHQGRPPPVSLYISTSCRSLPVPVTLRIAPTPQACAPYRAPL